MRRIGFASTAALLLTTSTAAFAEPTDPKKAESLYNEALSLADAGKYEEACPKYAESQKLDPALGTQFNLADCYEHTGRLATAFKNFGEVERAARAAGKTNLSNKAGERANALGPKVPRLAIELPPNTPDLVVKLDQETVGDPKPIPVDSGRHAIDATAPGRKPWHGEVQVGKSSETVRVGPLAPADEAPPIPTSTDEPKHGTSGLKIAGVAIAGIGVIGLVVGGISGASALSKRDDARSQCGSDDPKLCHSETGVKTWADAKSAGTISTIGFIAGGALLAAGVVLWIVAPSHAPKQVGQVGKLEVAF